MPRSRFSVGLGLPSLPACPSVVVIVPCRNERNDIRRLIDNVLALDYDPPGTGILIVDGLSTDGTREILAEYQSREPRIRVLDNPAGGTPAAINIGIRESGSDVVVRLDVRASYPRNYISHLVRLLSDRRADNVGGVRATDPGVTAWSKTIASLVSHRFATGDAHWRSGTPGLEVSDSVYCGCFRREVFERVGPFNETVVRIEDRELNYRLKSAGGLILLDPSIECIYYPRLDGIDYCEWTFRGAFHLFRWSLAIDPGMLRWRNFIPAGFLMYHAVPFIFLHSRWFTLSLLPLLAYWVLNLLCAFSESRVYRCWRVAPLLAAGFYLTHVLYGAGSLMGAAAWAFRDTRHNPKERGPLVKGMA